MARSGLFRASRVRSKPGLLVRGVAVLTAAAVAAGLVAVVDASVGYGVCSRFSCHGCRYGSDRW